MEKLMVSMKKLLSIGVIVLFLSLSMFPAINGDVESRVIENIIEEDINIDEDLILVINERLEEYKINQDCGCESNHITDDDFPVFICLIIWFLYFSFMSLVNAIEMLGLRFTPIHNFIFSIWSNIGQLMIDFSCIDFNPCSNENLKAFL